MATYKTPGVYVEEISTLPASVAQVETAIPAFIGYTEKAIRKGQALRNVPTRIKSFPEYLEFFGGPELQTGYGITVTDIIDAQANVLDRNIVIADPTTTKKTKFLMWYSLQLYFNNGGGPCYIVSVGDYSTAPTKDPMEAGLVKLKVEDEPTLILFPDATKLGVTKKADFYGLYSLALDQCNLMKDRFTIVDTLKDGMAGINELRNTLSSDYLKYGAAYYPYLSTTLSIAFDEDGVTITHDTIDSEDATKTAKGLLDTKKLNETEVSTENNELYNQIKNELNAKTMTLPPSSAMAGVYARVDSDRGVWKAPANVSINGIIKPTSKITNEEQESMNVDATGGKSINAIRSFTGKGTLVWGARTLAGNDNEWRYVSVRRFYNMVEESVKKASERVVFESNDANTWIKVKAQIENYLNNLWRQGALAGAVPAQAFFVNIGLGQTMTAQDILEGRMIVEVGMAVVRPAEFIILRFSHKMQES